MVFRASDKWAPRETAMVTEWVAKTFPMDRVIIRARVGAPDASLVEQVGEARADALSKVFKRWVDAVIIRPQEVILVEAKIRGTPAALGQLVAYRDLFRKTPEFRDVATRPTRLLLLTPWDDADLKDTAASLGIDVVNYRPPWLDEYLQMLQGYTTREAVARRNALSTPPPPRGSAP
jgi:hypothetical protein